MKVLKEAPLFNVKTNDILYYYDLIYSFFLELKRTGKVSVRNKFAAKRPGWAASEILFLALYGYTKKNKFSTQSPYLKWHRPPKTLETRILSLLGNEFRKYFKIKKGELQPIKDDGKDKNIAKEKDILVSARSYVFRTDDEEVQSRMQEYIEDFDLHSSIDKDVLKNLVKTQMLIEHSQNILLKGGQPNTDIKSLSEQLRNYTNILGLSKKDRADLGSERKKGSVGELALIYEQTLQEYPDLEQQFFHEELNMLLDKYERLTPDDKRELSAKAFRVISGGFTVEEARQITGRKRRYVKKKRTSDT
jgi:hypothetical protein